MKKAVILFALLSSSTLLADRLPWSEWLRRAPRVADSDTAGIVVRQYTGTTHMTALLANPGPGVTGIHVLSYATTAAGVEASLTTDASSARASGLKVYLGHRIGQIAPSSGCLSAQHWIDVAAVFTSVDAIALDDEAIVFDGENYYTGQECTDAWLTSQGSSAAALKALMTPLLDAVLASGHRVGYYPANADDAAMRAIFDVAADGSEAWMEWTFGTALSYSTDPVYYRAQMETADKAWRAIEATHPNVHRRDGHFDDMLRRWGDPFRGEAAASRSWVFDYTRSDRSSWGTSSWISGASAQGLNAGILNAWPMMPLDGGGSSIPDLVSGEPLAEKWGVARQSAGYGTPGLIRREGWGPGLEWLAEGYVASTPSAQSYRVGVKLDDVSGDRAILSIWTDHPSGNTFALWLDDGAVVLDVYSTNYTTTRITVDASPTTAARVYVFGFDGVTVRVEGKSDVTLASPVSPKTLVRIGLKGQSVSPVFASSSVYVGPIIRWGRLLSSSEMAAAKAAAWPFGRGL